MNECNELLENIQKSLHHCCTNTQKYKFTNPNNKFMYPFQCENIVNYEKKLKITKIEINCENPTINTDQEYFVNYDCNSRKIAINQ
jgi:hypothetical protein